MSSTHRKNGTPYSKETINNYIKALESYSYKLDGLDVKKKNLFEYDNFEDFSSVRNMITSHHQYNELNISYHRIFSSALQAYSNFLSNGVAVSQSSNYDKFKNWLENYSQRTYRESTIKRYLVALEKAEERLSIQLDLEIWQIKNIEQFNSCFEIITQSKDYEFVNKKYGNGDLSAALSAYKKFILELNNDCNDKTNNKKEFESVSIQIDSKFGNFDSWEIVDDETAIKTCDKSFFDYNSSGVPKEICWYFDAENIASGEYSPIKFIFDGKEYDGKLTNDSTDRRRIQIRWNSELGKLFAVHKDTEAKATFIKKSTGVYEISILGGEKEMTVREQIDAIESYIAAKGFNYDGNLVENFYLSLKSKPFVILAGTSGTGKTRLVRLFAEAIGAEYTLVSVRPDWSDSSDLFGHVDLNQKFIKGDIIDFVKSAELNPTKPYILCLDEMNLARVEYYMSDILSTIETRRFENGQIVTDAVIPTSIYGNDTSAEGKYGKVILPGNLYIVGTVNMDETTFPFSKKVLDRANTIEFSFVNLMAMPSFEKNYQQPQKLPNSFLSSNYITLNDCEPNDRDFIENECAKLQRINNILETANAHIGYRVRDEIVFYLLNNNKENLLEEYVAFDNQIMQKILPRIQGSSESIKTMLEELLKVCESEKYVSSTNKINFMIKRYEEDGFTSYWL